MQVTGQSDRETAPASLNTVAAGINRRLEWWYATGLVPPVLAALSGFWFGSSISWLVGALISFAAFVLTLALWYRAVLRPVSRRHAQGLVTAFGGPQSTSLANQIPWPLVKHALQIYQNQRRGSAVPGAPAPPAHSGIQEL